MDDNDLLDRYCRKGDQEAFAELVRRHGDWIYASARRQLGDAHLAEDATQAVFLLLARKAAHLSPHSNLGGWLFGTLRYCIKETQRQRSRQQHHEKEAAQMRQDPKPESTWDAISPLLDNAIARLANSDREAILLRFYQRKPLAEVGRALGTTEEAARKRVDRAVDRLRQHLAAGGIEAQSLGLSALILAHAADPGPAGLATKITEAVARGIGSAPAGGIAQGAAKMMTLAKMKAAAGFAVTAMVTTGLAVGAATSRAAPTSQPLAQSTAAPASQPAGAKLVLADLASANILHAHTRSLALSAGEGPDTVDVWFVRGKGIANIGHWAGTTAVQLDDGENSWRYRVGGKVVGRSTSEKTVEQELQRISRRLSPLADLGPVRDPSGDRVLAGSNCRCYRLAQKDNRDQISAIWVDDANRLSACESSKSHENQIEITYDEDPPASLFSTVWPNDVEVIDSDAYLAQQFPIAKAIFTKEVAGLVFAVHEAKADDRGCYYVICSVRPSEGTDANLGKSKGYMGGVSMSGSARTAGGELEPLGYIPHEIASLQSVYGWTQVEWFVFTPDPSTPAPAGQLCFTASAQAVNELEAWRKSHGLPATGEFLVELQQQQMADVTVADFARGVWAEGDRLWPAVDGTLWMAKSGEHGGQVLNPSRPGRIPQNQYVANVQWQIEQALKPQRP